MVEVLVPLTGTSLLPPAVYHKQLSRYSALLDTCSAAEVDLPHMLLSSCALLQDKHYAKE